MPEQTRTGQGTYETCATMPVDGPESAAGTGHLPVAAGAFVTCEGARQRGAASNKTPECL
mgnify:CR=1 FL=1